MLALRGLASIVAPQHLLVLLTAFAAASIGCEKSPAGSQGPSAPQGGAAGTPPSIHLVADPANGTWPMPAGDYGNLRYSPLSMITTSNVKDLHAITTMS